MSARIAICAAQIPFVPGGAEFLYESLRDALVRVGPQAKSVSLPHLMARVTALLRRADLSSMAPAADERLVRGPLTLDLQRFEARWRDTTLDLTVTEFWILHSLAKFPGHVKDRDALMREANMLVDDHTITSYVKRMRRKFEAVDPGFCSIETVYGMGYRFVEQPV